MVCKLFGYATVEEYYTAGSSMHYIPDIKTPSLFLIAQDDPFLGKLPIQVWHVLVVKAVLLAGPVLESHSQ